MVHDHELFSRRAGLIYMYGQPRDAGTRPPVHIRKKPPHALRSVAHECNVCLLPLWCALLAGAAVHLLHSQACLPRVCRHRCEDMAVCARRVGQYEGKGSAPAKAAIVRSRERVREHFL